MDMRRKAVKHSGNHRCQLFWLMNDLKWLRVSWSRNRFRSLCNAGTRIFRRTHTVSTTEDATASLCLTFITVFLPKKGSGICSVSHFESCIKATACT